MARASFFCAALVSLCGAISLLGAGAAIAADVSTETPETPVPNAPAAAQKVSGYLELYGQALWNNSYTSGSYPGANPWLGIGGAGALNVWLNPSWSMQFDAFGNVAFPQKVNGAADNVSTETVAGHFDWRDPSRGLLGAFVGIAGTNDYEATGQDWSVFLGPEAQVYLGNFTLYGQGGWLHQFSGTYGGPGTYSYYQIDNLWFGQLTGRYFPQPNTKIEASIGYMNGPIWGPVYYGSAYDAGAVTYSAEVEHRFDNSPFSVFGRFSGFTSPGYNGGTASEYAVMAGFRAQFGTGTLEEQDRSGATLKAPDFGPIGWLRWDD